MQLCLAETEQCRAGNKNPHLLLLVSTTLMALVINRQVGQNPLLHDEWLGVMGTMAATLSFLATVIELIRPAPCGLMWAEAWVSQAWFVSPTPGALEVMGSLTCSFSLKLSWAGSFAYKGTLRVLGVVSLGEPFGSLYQEH